MTEAAPIRFVERSERRLAYRWLGPAPNAAPTLVFLHEGLGAITTWRDFPERAVERTGWGALVYDRRGYGRSSPCPLPRPLRYMEQEAEDDLPAMLAALGVRRCALVGHSDGASIAVAHAAGPRHPSVEALVLVAPHVFVERMAQEAIRETGRRFSRGPLKESLRRHHGDNLECAFRGWHDAWLDPGFEASFDLRPRLGGIDVPSLLVQGLDDPYGTLAQIDALARGVDGPVERLLLPGCGHAPHREAARPLLDALVGFAHQVL